MKSSHFLGISLIFTIGCASGEREPSPKKDQKVVASYQHWPMRTRSVEQQRAMLEAHLYGASRQNLELRQDLEQQRGRAQDLSEELRRTQEELAAALVALDPMWGHEIPVRIVWFRCTNDPSFRLKLTPIGRRDQTPVLLRLMPPDKTPDGFYVEPRTVSLPVGLYKVEAYEHGRQLYVASRPMAISSLLHKPILTGEGEQPIEVPTTGCTIILMPAGYRVTYVPGK